jgi:hypothetical protein
MKTKTKLNVTITLALTLALTFAFGAVIGAGLNHPTHVQAATVLPPQVAGGQQFDPVLIVHQSVNGGPVSVYLSHDPAVVAQVQSTPDGGCNRQQTTCYIEGSPYLTNSVTTVTDMLYTGLNNPPPPAH